MMIFRQWQQVLNGTKTQTRRLIKPGEFASGSRGGGRCQIFGVWKDIHDLQDRSGQFGFTRTPLQILQSLYRLKWHRAMGCFADKTYAVQPGRGKKAVGRIRIIAIRRERLQDISPADCSAEGIRTIPNEWGTPWYSYVSSDLPSLWKSRRRAFAALWDSIYSKKSNCSWEDNPEVWVLEFEEAQQ